MDVKDLFQEKFGAPPTARVASPGRLELLGNHTDYNEGLVMSLAVDKYISIAASPRPDGRIVLVTSEFPETEAFFVDELAKNPAAPWADYFKGVLSQLRQRGVHYSGLNAAIHGTIPMGAGMSSSAAFEVATALTMRQLYPYHLAPGGLGPAPARQKDGTVPPLAPDERMEVARLCQAAENQFVGVKCGLLDQISVLFGKAHHAIETDFRSLKVETVPMLGEVAIVVCNSGVKHALVGGEYNERRQNCEAAARKLGLKSLRSADLEMLEARKNELAKREYQCARHIVGEIQRVVVGARALRDGDFVQFGQYMFDSHRSSQDFFKNSCPELDLLVDLARQTSACLGARLTGGGFGGATINLVKRPAVEQFMTEVAAGYRKQTGQSITPVRCEIVDGVS